MKEPPSPTVDAVTTINVVGVDARTSGASAAGGAGRTTDDIAIDVDRWRRLAAAVLTAEGRRGELTLTFVDADEIAALNREHMGNHGPTDVLSFPLDADQPESYAVASAAPGAPPAVLLGDVVICPAVAAAQAADHAGTLDDELALLVVHGVLHVLGHDHALPDESAAMRRRELDHLCALHWGGDPPAGFRQDHPE